MKVNEVKFTVQSLTGEDFICETSSLKFSVDEIKEKIIDEIKKKKLFLNDENGKFVNEFNIDTLKFND